MKSEDIARYVAGLEEEVERLRAAQPALPDVGPVTREGGEMVVDGETYRATGFPSAYYRERGHVALREAALRYAIADALDTEAAAADTTPDTSRVTFGTRHKETEMVLLRHADLSGTWWGEDEEETAKHHQYWASNGFLDRAAHAALAEVREALNTAEADGVDVWYQVNPAALCGVRGAFPDDPLGNVLARARRLLAREVQALLDQGLRGDDLNARFPFEVRDHRAARTSEGGAA